MCIAAALTFGGAGCIDKPLKPSERPADAGPDAGPDASTCDEPPDERMAWDADDTVRLDQVTAQLNDDCFDDLLLPGSTDDATHGVFVVLGRSAANFFTGGYDQFIATTGSEPLRVAATNLVGGAPLDLVVFARKSSAPSEGEAEVRVFEGVGDGTFLGEDISMRIAESSIPATDLEEPGRFTVERLRAAAGGVDELVIGNSASAYVIAPASWTQAGLSAAAFVPPFGAPSNQGVMVAPSGRPGADDLVQVDNASWHWFVNQGPLAYEEGSVNAMVDSGPRVLRLPEEHADTDIATVSVQEQHLSFLFFTPPSATGSTGALVVKAFGSSVDTADGLIDAVELIGLGGGTAPELLVLDAGSSTDSAVLWLFHDLTDFGEKVEAANEGQITAAPFDSDHPYNRMAVGAFRGPDEREVYLFSSAPGGQTPPVCWFPDPASGDLRPCD